MSPPIFWAPTKLKSISRMDLQCEFWIVLKETKCIPWALTFSLVQNASEKFCNSENHAKWRLSGSPSHSFSISFHSFSEIEKLIFSIKSSSLESGCVHRRHIEARVRDRRGRERLQVSQGHPAVQLQRHLPRLEGRQDGLREQEWVAEWLGEARRW